MRVLRERGLDGGGVSYRDFTEVALYDGQAGYYRKAGRRVGRARDADFYTAESLGGVFGRLVAEAAGGLAEAAGLEPERVTFVEAGLEPGGGSGVLEEAAKVFGAVRALPLGEPAEALPEQRVVFANEVLDAQPFVRLLMTESGWRELGVAAGGDEGLKEVVLRGFSADAASIRAALPGDAPAGYRVDYPVAAERLLERWAAGMQAGALLVIDYGRTWEELVRHCPAGTARAYYRHEASRELLARPGGQDLTCDVAWDRLTARALEAGLEVGAVERQEAFFVKRAGGTLRAIVERGGPGFSPERQTLQELLHPGHLGAKFQVMTALRRARV